MDVLSLSGCVFLLLLEGKARDLVSALALSPKPIAVLDLPEEPEDKAGASQPLPSF